MLLLFVCPTIELVACECVENHICKGRNEYPVAELLGCCGFHCGSGVDDGGPYQREYRASAKGHDEDGGACVGPFAQVMDGERPYAGIDDRVGDAHEHEAPY